VGERRAVCGAARKNTDSYFQAVTKNGPLNEVSETAMGKQCIRATAAERVTFVIQAENRKEVLTHVVLRFQGLNVEIDALYMVRRRVSERMRMYITIQSDRELAGLVEGALNKVTGVKTAKIERGGKDHLDRPNHTGQGSPGRP
jgi:acetolactate synthase regulatory subunit